MVSHLNWKVLNVNEDFVIVLTFKLNACFVDGFALEMNS